MQRREFILSLLAFLSPMPRGGKKPQRRTYGSGIYGFGTYGGN